MTAEVALAILGAVVLLVWLVLAKANRIDLLHQKVTRTAATLDAQLLRRAGLATELATSGLLDPASSLLVAEAADAALAEVADPDLEAEGGRGVQNNPGRATLTSEREVVESELSRVLRQALEGEWGDDSVPPRIVEDVLAAWRRAGLARRFYNDAVAQTIRIRLQTIVRWLRLAGRAGMPRMFEMDDSLPDDLG